MSLDDELRKVRARQDEAVRAQAAQGSTREGLFEAAVRASLDHAIENIDPGLADLEGVLGELDAGAFLMGMMGAAFAMNGIDLVEAAKLRGELFREYIAKARDR